MLSPLRSLYEARCYPDRHPKSDRPNRPDRAELHEYKELLLSLVLPVFGSVFLPICLRLTEPGRVVI